MSYVLEKLRIRNIFLVAMVECQNKWIPMIVSGVCNRDTFTIWNFAIILPAQYHTHVLFYYFSMKNIKYSFFSLEQLNYLAAGEMLESCEPEELSTLQVSGKFYFQQIVCFWLMSDGLLKNLMLAELSWVQRLADQYLRLYQLLNLHSCPQQIIHKVWNWSQDYIKSKTT